MVIMLLVTSHELFANANILIAPLDGPALPRKSKVRERTIQTSKKKTRLGYASHDCVCSMCNVYSSNVYFIYRAQCAHSSQSIQLDGQVFFLFSSFQLEIRQLRLTFQSLAFC